MNREQVKTKLAEIDSAQTSGDKAQLCREMLKELVEGIYRHLQVKLPEKATLLELIDNLAVVDWVNDADMIQAMHYVRILGMNAEHGAPIRRAEAKLAVENISAVAELIDHREHTPDVPYKKPPYMSEANTRKLYIDLYPREAGWEVMETENVPMPSKAGIEIEVEGMPYDSGLGYCDYVLYGRDGKPLAIVEAKRTSISPEKGRHQVDLYGDCMKKRYGYKPVLYYTNGYTTKVMDGMYPDRQVLAFHTQEELELMLQQRGRGDITDLRINDGITNRPYQKTAITRLCEKLNKNYRRGLLVMATGTGKTRVSISLVDILTRNNWVKNVLFLADRTSLVRQAKQNYAKLMPNTSICELSGKDKPDYNARLMFSTYQTMINYIDAEDKQFKSGRFDLIIIDEAHRSIFNRYGSIFKYFDSLLVGLTATPKNEVDANTYSLFGCESGMPDSDYSLEEAIDDHYLVGYKVINRTSLLINEGIDPSKLTPEEREQLDDYFAERCMPTPDFNVPGNELFRFLFNKDTCRQVIEELVSQGLRVNNGETLGKSIIFAYNHKHAQMIVDCFHELYPDYPANTCQLVDNYVQNANSLVEQFDTNPEFRIAVSVDMLDTGVDIPAVLNLVFFKKVRSKIKFVQMIGRGTRLCENIYGPGRDKSGFCVFDYCGNFEFFGNLPKGKPSQGNQWSLTQRLFALQADMLYGLQDIQYQEDEWFKGYYEELKKSLHSQIGVIKSHSTRIQVRAEMQFVDKFNDWGNWTALTPVVLQELRNHIVPLLDSGIQGQPLSIAFDCRMLHVALSLVCNGNLNEAAKDVKKIREVANYLLEEKASIPQVLAKADDLKQIRDDNFWQASPSVRELERLRQSLRDLMQFLQGEGRAQYDIDIMDTINDGAGVDPTAIDIRTYRQKVIDYLTENINSSVIQKIHHLEPINEEDLLELERILWHELGSKEDYNKTTDINNLAAFVRSLVGLSQETVNEKFSEYLNDNTFNAMQQEYIRNIINYVRVNGDMDRSDIVNTAPFNNYDLKELFDSRYQAVIQIVSKLHDPITVSAA